VKIPILQKKKQKKVGQRGGNRKRGRSRKGSGATSLGILRGKNKGGKRRGTNTKRNVLTKEREKTHNPVKRSVGGGGWQNLGEIRKGEKSGGTGCVSKKKGKKKKDQFTF